MTFSLRGSDSRGATSTVCNTNAHGISIASGDLVVWFVHSNNTDSFSAVQGTGAAWTELYDAAESTKSNRHGLFWKTANSSEPTQYECSARTSADFRSILYVFSGSGSYAIDASLNSERDLSNSTDMVVSAQDGQVISDDAVAFAFAGKDSRGGSESYTTAGNSFTGVLGATTFQRTAGAYRIYTTGETASGSLVIETADSNDGSASTNLNHHISFVESGGSSVAPLAMHHLTKNLS